MTAASTPYGQLETQLRQRRELGVKSLVVYLTGGLPGWLDMVRAAADAGADIVVFICFRGVAAVAHIAVSVQNKALAPATSSPNARPLSDIVTKSKALAHVDSVGNFIAILSEDCDKNRRDKFF